MVSCFYPPFQTHTSIQAGPAPGGWGKGAVPCPVVDKAIPPLVPSSVLLPLAVQVAATMKATSGPAFALCSLLLLLLLLQVPDSLGLASQPRGKGTVDDGDTGSVTLDKWPGGALSTETDGG